MITQDQANKLWHEMFLLGSFEEAETNDMKNLLEYCDFQYHNGGSSPLSDDEYDTLRLFLVQETQDENLVNAIGFAVPGEKKVVLDYQMGSLTQAQIGGDIKKWINEYSLHEEDIIITDKLDGISSQIQIESGALLAAFTRGDGYEGTIITHHITHIPSLPNLTSISNLIVIRAELIIKQTSKESFDRDTISVLKRPYKNLRNAVAGIMNRDDVYPQLLKHIDIVAYEIMGSDLSKTDQLQLLKTLGFKTPVTKQVKGKSLDDDYLQRYIENASTTTEYEIDGIVLDVDSAVRRSEINPTTDTLNPEYARKYKINLADNMAEATVIDVEWNLSKHGYYKPRIKINPIELEGVTIQHVTGHNAKFITDGGIGRGSKLKIIRSGGVIPYVAGVITPVKLQPSDLPAGEYVWSENKVDFIATGVDLHQDVVVKQLVDFFKSMGIDLIGAGNTERLYVAGYQDIIDILLATEHEIQQAVGSNIIGSNIFSSIHTKLQSGTIPEYQFAGSLTIFGRGIGVRKMKKLWEYYQGDLNLSYQQIMMVDGFDDKTATKIVSGLLEYQKLKQRLGQTLKFKPFKQAVGNWKDKQVVFTGIRSKTAEQKIEEQGGKIGSSVSKKTSYVVAADSTNITGKLQKAVELNIPIISLDELMELLSV